MKIIRQEKHMTFAAEKTFTVEGMLSDPIGVAR
jgi:hypothetical protein